MGFKNISTIFRVRRSRVLQFELMLFHTITNPPLKCRVYCSMQSWNFLSNLLQIFRRCIIGLKQACLYTAQRLYSLLVMSPVSKNLLLISQLVVQHFVSNRYNYNSCSKRIQRFSLQPPVEIMDTYLLTYCSLLVNLKL